MDDRLLDLVYEFDAKMERLESELAAERDFRKVHVSIYLLLFVYGLMYGVYLCPK
jgi:hypothetical protein